MSEKVDHKLFLKTKNMIKRSTLISILIRILVPTTVNRSKTCSMVSNSSSISSIIPVEV